MKKLFKKSVLSGAIIALGIVVGYAEITAFQGLDAILDNFDYILNLNTSKQAEIKELDEQVSNLIIEPDNLITERDDLIVKRNQKL